jgi:hypothetical protein
MASVRVLAMIRYGFISNFTPFCVSNMFSLKLVAQALRFLSTAIRSGLFKELLGNRETIKILVNGIVVPNVELRGWCEALDTKKGIQLINM